MIGIELGAPGDRWARVNWRLIQMASEGLFPQLIVIPLHRDHGVITMAAGKNDVIKLLPPLTLSEAEARALPRRLRRGARRLRGRRGKNWSVVRDIATATLRRARAAVRTTARATAPFRGRPVDPVRGRTSAWSRARPASSAGAWPSGWCATATRCAAWCARAATPRCSSELGVELAVGDLTRSASLARAATGCQLRLSLRRAGVRLGHHPGDRARSTSRAPATCSSACAAASVQALRPLQHHRRLRLSGRRRGRGDLLATRFRNWYAQTKLAAEAEVRRVGHERTAWTR